MRSAAFVFLLVAVSSTLSAQSAKQILKKYFEAIGGVHNIRSFKSAAHTSVHIQHLPTLDTIRVDLMAKAPHSFSFRSFKKGDLVYEAYGNSKGQTMYVYKPYPNKYEKERVIVPLTTSHELLTAFEKTKVKRLADTTINEVNAYTVQASVSKSELSSSKKYYFDKSTHLLIGFSSNAISGDFNYLDEYTSIENILLPLKSRYVIKGKLVTEYTIKNFSVNPALDDSLFIAKSHQQAKKQKLRLNRKIEFFDSQTNNLHFDDFIKRFEGRTVLIDLWATWCAPCKVEFEKLDDPYFHFLQSKNIEVVYLSFDQPGSEANWKKAIDDFVLTGTHAMAGKKLQQSIQHKFFQDGMMYIPRLILIGPTGEILSPELPKLSSGFFYAAVNALVK